MLTTKTLYSLVAIADIAKNGKTEPVRLCDVAKRQKLSVHYLEQLARKLRVAGIIVSVRGPGGGYVLGKEFQNQTVKDVLKACGERVLTGKGHDLATNTTEANRAKDIIKKLNLNVVSGAVNVPLSSLAF